MHRRPTASISKSQKPGKARKAQLPAIAPRYQLVSNKSDPTIIASVNVPRTRLPPRSRFGCWCVSFLPFIFSWAFRLTVGVQDVSGNRFPSRLDTLFLKLTDMLADTQGQVSTPSDVVLQQQAYTHRHFFFLDVMKLGPNAQCVRHDSIAFTADMLRCYD